MPEPRSDINSLQALLEQFPKNSPLLTPGFNPNQPNPSVGGTDLNALIQQLMQPQQAPQPQGKGGIGGILEAILGALGQGAAVYGSQNPGGTLAAQIGQRSQEKFAKEQYEREQSDRQNQIRQQFGLRILDSKLGEESDIRKEGRMSGLRKEEARLQEEAEVRKFNREMTGDELKDSWRFKQQKDLLDIQLAYNKKRDEVNDDRARDLKDEDTNVKKIQLKFQVAQSIGSFGPADVIVEKFFANEKLTPKEQSLLTLGAQRERRVAANAGRRSSGGSGGGSSDGDPILTDKNQDMLEKQIILNEISQERVQIKNPDGKPGPTVKLSDAPKDVFGNPDESRIIKRLTEADRVEYVLTEVVPALDRLKVKRLKVDPKVKLGTQVDPSTSRKAEHYQKTFNDFVQQGYPAAEVGKEMLRKFPADKELIEGIIIRSTKKK